MARHKLKKSGLAALWRIATIIPPARSPVVLGCPLVSGLAGGFGIARLPPLPGLERLGQERAQGVCATCFMGFAIVRDLRSRGATRHRGWRHKTPERLGAFAT